MIDLQSIFRPNFIPSTILVTCDIHLVLHLRSALYWSIDDSSFYGKVKRVVHDTMLQKEICILLYNFIQLFRPNINNRNKFFVNIFMFEAILDAQEVLVFKDFLVYRQLKRHFLILLLISFIISFVDLLIEDIG